ncbi:MAG: sugar phosphate isomerase/epimerase [Clostridiales bacterium]|nr:sugar phosphate isomerase/epimerase [Clostridiales bacterium]
MKIGVFSILFNDWSLDDTLDYLVKIGAEAVELGTGGYSRSNHCIPDELLTDEIRLEEFKDKFKKRNLFISALSTHGNPVHPDKEVAVKHHEDFEKTVLLAEKLGIETVLVLSGCPGGSPRDETPNWTICAWPEDFPKILEYQWNEVLVPYWKKAASFAKNHGVNKIAVEPHPGFCVYNTETLLRLRVEVGREIGVNFDPSHFFWQGMDTSEAILTLGDSIYHIHAKDTALNMKNISVNGVLDAKHYSKVKERSWLFRTVGYGHSSEVWRNMISALATVGYDSVLSIEHEDCLMSREEGLEKAIGFLKEIIIREKLGKMWWETRAEG